MLKGMGAGCNRKAGLMPPNLKPIKAGLSPPYAYAKLGLDCYDDHTGFVYGGRVFCPGGALENSPAIYRWVEKASETESPGGTTERGDRGRIQPSLRDWMRSCGIPFPAIKRLSN